ncbi:unnamed protein product [Ostreobium quekettii]|uniref:Uncharacterized protein n=1 Tax=Ostreobium quekettii TaxID=121088 RepID=A0A8S1IQG3_9CHLO|nr:unnamed protein product [Ostreobium quekettii]
MAVLSCGSVFLSYGPLWQQNAALQRCCVRTSPALAAEYILLLKIACTTPQYCPTANLLHDPTLRLLCTGVPWIALHPPDGLFPRIVQPRRRSAGSYLYQTYSQSYS